MTAPFTATLPRHRWVHVAATAHDVIAAFCADRTQRNTVLAWLGRGFPLVSRGRQAPDAGLEHPLGLCLLSGRAPRRIALGVPSSGILSVDPTAPLHEVASVLPREMADVARQLSERGRALGFEVRAFGSAAWQWRTGDAYLHDDSDLDILAAPPTAAALAQWLPELARLNAVSPMRIDGEIEFPNGDAVSWRDLAKAPAEVLVKSSGGARLDTTPRVWALFP